MAISAVGSPATATGTAQTTLAYTPSTIGDCVLVGVSYSVGNTVSVTGITDTNSKTSGAFVLGVARAAAGAGASAEIWCCPIVATGATTLTVAFSGSIASVSIRIAAQQLTAGLGATTVWGHDGVSQFTAATAATIPWPTMTPAASGEAYVGNARSANAITAGSTTGFTYYANGVTCLLWNGTVSSGTGYAPTATQTSGIYVTVAALLTATLPPSANAIVMIV